MRSFRLVGFLGLILALAGCSSTRWSWLKPNPTNDSKTVAGTPSAEQLVEYLNTNSSRINSLWVSDVDITATSGFQSIGGLQGKMAIQRTAAAASPLAQPTPKNFRFSVASTVGQEVDLGSNEQEFWFYIKRDQPYQFYCNHSDWNAGKVDALKLPFQPEWIVEVLGLGQYGPPEKYQVEGDRDHIRLVERTRTAQGIAVKKVIVMKRRKMDVPEPQVTQFLLLEDGTNKEICSATISQAMVLAGAMLPKRMELKWTETRTKLALNFRDVNPNPTPAIDQSAFLRRPLNGIASMNLATKQLDSPGVQPVQNMAP